MAINSYSGFDGCNSITDAVLGPLSATNFSTPSSVVVSNDTTKTRGGQGKSLIFSQAGGYGVQPATVLRVFNSTKVTAFAGVAAKLLATFNYTAIVLALNNSVSTTHIYAVIDSTGFVAVYRNNNPSQGFFNGNYTKLGTGQIANVNMTAWNYFEIKGTIDPTNGSVVIRCNNVECFSLSGVQTSADGTSSMSAFSFGVCPSNSQGSGSYTNNEIAYFDDMYLADTSGAINNDFLGSRGVKTFFPSGNGTFHAFAPSANTNWNNVSDPSFDGDASYNASSTDGDIDSFTWSGLGTNPSSITAVQITVAAKVATTGSDTLAPFILSNGTQSTPQSFLLSTDYTFVPNIWTQDPNTNAAWTPSGLNAIEFGYKRVS